MNIETKEIDVPAPDRAARGDGGEPVLSAAAALPFLGGLKVRITAQVGQAELTVKELMALAPGATFPLERLVDQPLDLLVDGHVIGQGTLVAVGDYFGVRITTAPRFA